MEHRSDAVFAKPSIFRDGIREYAERSSSPVSAELAEIAEETARATPEWADISTTAVQATFLQMLISTAGMRRVLEVGTFTGHGTVAMAAALPDDGEILTIDSYVADKRTQDVASKAFERSSHGHKIKPVLDDALSALQEVEGDFDLIFLDADKPNYISYFETILARRLLRPRGLLVIDNTLWGGEVLNPRDLPPAEEASTGQEWVERMFANWAHDVVKFNRHIAADPRVRTAVLTVQDGMTLVQLAS
ncbi:class I SAM-dependent methyltransferase [Streptomyces sp. URMC 126]|uniref:class I SAM-dependent methyltransferase n=1 Tax=Streptomyces sp. URMC 126 TaxID=3423401 RepID=UPI003F1C8165